MMQLDTLLSALATLALFPHVDAGSYLVSHIKRNQEPSQPSCSNFTAFNYAGCFKDLSSPRALLFSGPSNKNMTVEICVAFCKGNEYKYAGLEYYRECFCGASVNGPQVNESSCSYPCAGDKTETCGANDFINIYQDTTFPTVNDSIISDYKPMGCYSEGSNGRSLAWRQSQLNPSSLTIEKCLFACKIAGFSFAGVEFGQECYCGVVLGNGTLPLSSSSCNIPCTGNKTETCGGRSTLNLYVAMDLESTQPCNGGGGGDSSSSSMVTSTTDSPSSSSSQSVLTTDGSTSQTSSSYLSSATSSSSSQIYFSFSSSSVDTSSSSSRPSSPSSALSSSSSFMDTTSSSQSSSTSSGISSSSSTSNTPTSSQPSSSLSSSSSSMSNIIDTASTFQSSSSTSSSRLSSSQSVSTPLSSLSSSSSTSSSPLSQSISSTPPCPPFSLSSQPPSSTKSSTSTQQSQTRSASSTSSLPPISSSSTASPTKTSVSLCTSTVVVSPTPTCEYKCGNWCSKPIPTFHDSPTCFAAFTSCAVQVSACFLQAGFPESLNCIGFSNWCTSISSYCTAYCPGSDCFNDGCKSKYPPLGPSLPSPTTSFSAYICQSTTKTSTKSSTSSIITSSMTTSSTCVPIPTNSNICKQPSNSWGGYDFDNPVGGIPLPCLTCNNLWSDYNAGYPFKLYTDKDTSNCPSYPRSGSFGPVKGCKDACDNQYHSCMNTYAEGCKYNKRSLDTYSKASQKCSNQWSDCYAINSGVTGSGRCGSWNTGWWK